MKVEFKPEPPAVAAIAREIKVSHRAFPLFGTARLFLDRPERHRVRITAQDDTVTLFQLGEGIISTDRGALEREAFRTLKDKYYREEVQQGEPPKGNFANVARLRASGLILGPTNHHAYQPTLRRIFEERYSKRMSFADFQQYEVEIVKDEQTINDWKEQQRSVTTYYTTQEAEEKSFKTPAEVEAHFRQQYLPQELKSGSSFETNGLSFRGATDRALGAALRDEFDRERGYPVNLVNNMRSILNDAALHFFKHRKRIVFISPLRPLRHPSGPAREDILAILKIIEANPRCSRHDLAVKLLGEHTESPDLTERKTALATDLHYLIMAGHVIEFSDGRLDLPLAPKSATTAADHEPERDAEMAATPATAEAAAAPAPVEARETGETPVAEVSAPEPVEEVTDQEPATEDLAHGAEQTVEVDASDRAIEEAVVEVAAAEASVEPSDEVVAEVAEAEAAIESAVVAESVHPGDAAPVEVAREDLPK